MADGIQADTRARLVLPRSAQPNFICEVCGEGFYQQRSHIKHVKRCVKRNLGSIERLVATRRRDPLEQATDWEAVEFQKKKFAHLIGR